MYKQVDLKRDPKKKTIPDPPLDWDEEELSDTIPQSNNKTKKDKGK